MYNEAKSTFNMNKAQMQKSQKLILLERLTPGILNLKSIIRSEIISRVITTLAVIKIVFEVHLPH